MASPDPSSILRSRGRSGPDRVSPLLATPADTLDVIEGTSDLQEIERFRYSIYIAEQHKPLPAANHKDKRLPDADDKTAVHFCLRNAAGKLVGYARLHYATDIPDATVARLGLDDLLDRTPKAIGFISKLMVDKSLRGRTNVVRLIMSMIRYGCDRFEDFEGAVFHCSRDLVPMYARMGFRAFGHPFTDPHVGVQTPMVAIFRDLEHFEQCRSPIAAVAQKLLPHPVQMATIRDYFVVKLAFHAGNEVADVPGASLWPRVASIWHGGGPTLA